MLNVPLIKFAVQTLGSVSAAKVVGDIVRNNTVATTVAEKVMVNVGSLVIGSMVMDAASKHLEEVWQSVQGNVRFEIKRVNDDAEGNAEDKGPK